MAMARPIKPMILTRDDRDLIAAYSPRNPVIGSGTTTRKVIRRDCAGVGAMSPEINSQANNPTPPIQSHWRIAIAIEAIAAASGLMLRFLDGLA